MSSLLFLVQLKQSVKKIHLRFDQDRVLSFVRIVDYRLVVHCLNIVLQGASVAPKKTVKVSESTSSLSGGGLDSLPREDISGKITPTLLKGLESPDWKVGF